MTEVQQYTVGNVTITAVVEAETAGVPSQLFFPESNADVVGRHSWLVPDFADHDGNIAFRVQAFVVRTATRVILVDPCVGNGKTRALPFWNHLSTAWLDLLAAAGVRPGDVNIVVHTHLHEDHVGWDTAWVDGQWTPTFANARHLYTQRELDFARERSNPADPVYEDSIEPIITAGLADIVAEDADLGEGLQLEPSPGHTPGHVSLWIRSGGQSALITGDFMHHPLQFAEPQLREVADGDIELARTTRTRMIEAAVTADALIVGTHFPSKPAGRAVPEGAAWKFVPSPDAEH